MTFTPGLEDRLAALEEHLADSDEAITTYRQALLAEFERLRFEAELQKRLSLYARRTWFEVLAYVVLVALLVNDLARAYAHTRWWGLLFWTTPHSANDAAEWVLRAVGFAWQVSLLVVLGRRSQVPDWVFDRTAPAESARVRQGRTER